MINKVVVFDSGIGGLNIFKALKDKFPNENFVYFCDNLHFPYGSKSVEFLKTRINKIVEYFKDYKAIVIACNTASSVYQLLNKNYDNVYEIISKTSVKAYAVSKNKRIGVIGTDVTVKLNQYQDNLQKLGAFVYSVPSSKLAEIAEHQDMLTQLEKEQLVMDFMKEKFKIFKVNNIDTLICGCTHFNYLISEFKKYLGDINYVVSDEVLIDSLSQVFNGASEKENEVILTTGDELELKNKLNSLNIKYQKIQKLEL